MRPVTVGPKKNAVIYMGIILLKKQTRQYTGSCAVKAITKIGFLPYKSPSLGMNKQLSEIPISAELAMSAI